MSAECIILGKVVELAVLLKALYDMRRAYREVKKMTTSDGKEHDVDMAFKDSLDRDVGVQKSGDGYRLMADCHGLSKEDLKKQSESIQQVVQRYAYHKVIKELQAQGYTVAEEEKRPDQTIRLLVRKWS